MIFRYKVFNGFLVTVGLSEPRVVLKVWLCASLVFCKEVDVGCKQSDRGL